jgi:hypothetical protein
MILLKGKADFGVLSRVVICGIQAVSPRAPVDILKVFMYRRKFFGQPFCAFAHSAMRGRSNWTHGERELLGAFVSNLNQCFF